MVDDAEDKNTKDKMYGGKCHCGDVTFKAKGLSDIWYCHCNQCQHLTGHCAAAAGVARTYFSYTGRVEWSNISRHTKAGHCFKCRSYLFWSRKNLATISILAGNIEDTMGLKVKGHIFVSQKKAYFEITDGLPQYEKYPPLGTRSGGTR